MARACKNLDIPVSSIKAIMEMSLGEVEILKRLVVREAQTRQMKQAEDEFLNKPPQTAETNTQEQMRTEIERTRKEQEFLFG